MPRNALRILFAAGLGLGAACFETGSEVDCPAGTSGCVCRDDGTCNAELDCNPDGNCIDPSCVDGTQACPCYGNGSCDSGLACVSNICQPGGGSTGGDPTTTTGEPNDSSDGSSAGQTTNVADSGDTAAEVDSGSADTSGSGCAEPCGPGEACDLQRGACTATAYGPCSPMLELCTPPAVCDDVGGGNFVCATPCVEAAPMCPTEGGSELVCVEQSGCQLPCTADDDCPPYEGMACIDDRCAYPAR